jgi:diaminohydroxyphosphoribosylaminopyrimidine deaminase/5-amino-6-(5-phosphoribosylamino)uracil reductase
LPRRHGEGGAVVLDVAGRAGRGLHIGSLLAALAENGLTRLMVEGGPTTWQAFLESGFVDEVCLVFGSGKAEGEVISVIPGDPDEFFARFELRSTCRRPLGPDRLLIYRHTSR